MHNATHMPWMWIVEIRIVTVVENLVTWQEITEIERTELEKEEEWNMDKKLMIEEGNEQGNSNLNEERDLIIFD